MRMLKRLGALVLVYGVLISPLHASEAKLREFLENVQTLQATFKQQTVDETGRTLDYASGKVYLQRPGKFRWDYQAEQGIPGQQLVADGESIFLYDPDLEQVTQRSLQDAINQVPSLLLVERSSTLDNFFVIQDIGDTDGQSWVALRPKSADAAYQQLLLGFGSNNLQSIELLDGLGNSTQLELYGVKTNAPIDAAYFLFKVPDGVDLLSE